MLMLLFCLQTSQKPADAPSTQSSSSCPLRVTQWSVITGTAKHNIAEKIRAAEKYSSSCQAEDALTTDYFATLQEVSH